MMTLDWLPRGLQIAGEAIMLMAVTAWVLSLGWLAAVVLLERRRARREAAFDVGLRELLDGEERP